MMLATIRALNPPTSAHVPRTLTPSTRPADVEPPTRAAPPDVEPPTHAAQPDVEPPTHARSRTPTPAQELHLHGVRSQPANLFRLAGCFDRHPATLMLGSGASSEFIDVEYARRCGLSLTPSSRTIRLADGSSARAHGQVEMAFTLTAAPGRPPIPFTATFTATPLQGYDAILRLTWLAEHDALVGWRNRTITVRSPGQPPRSLGPLECNGVTGQMKYNTVVSNATSIG